MLNPLIFQYDFGVIDISNCKDSAMSPIEYTDRLGLLSLVPGNRDTMNEIYAIDPVARGAPAQVR